MGEGDLYTKTKCGYWLDPEFKGVSIAAETFWHRCRSVAKHLKTDGCLDERQMASTGVRGWRRLRDELIASSLFEKRDEDVIFIRGWMNWNKTKAQIDEVIQARREAGRAGGVRSGEARKPKQVASTLLSKSEANNEANTQAGGSSKTNPETETETETETENSKESFNSDLQRAREPVPDFDSIEDEPEPGDYLVNRAMRTITVRNSQTYGEMEEVIRYARRFVADQVIDEAIGWSAKQQPRPRFPIYVLKAIQTQAKRYGIAIEDRPKLVS